MQKRITIWFFYAIYEPLSLKAELIAKKIKNFELNQNNKTLGAEKQALDTAFSPVAKRTQLPQPLCNVAFLTQ